MRRTSLFVTLVMLVAVVMSIAGCGNSQDSSTPSTSPNKELKIGFAMTMDDPYWQNMVAGAKDEAQKLGATITFMDAKEDVDRQMEQISQLIAQKVDAVCLVPMKPDGLAVSVRALNAAKIPVIIVNREIGSGCDYVAFTGTDVYAGGIVAAKLLVRSIGDEGDIAELQQVIGSGPQIARSKALQDVLKGFPKVKLVAQMPHEGSDTKAAAAAGELLAKYPSLKGMYVQGDPQAIAVAGACQSAGRGDIAVVGFGGSAQAIDAIKQGKLTGTAYQQPEEEGRSGIRLAVHYLKGEKLDKRYPIPCLPITKDNASQFNAQF